MNVLFSGSQPSGELHLGNVRDRVSTDVHRRLGSWQ